jgi:predicted transcriptional regulator of viral defense system
MARRGETKAIVLAYLREERWMGPMLKYMRERHGISSSAVREQVRRLAQAGKLERVGRGRYRRI